MHNTSQLSQQYIELGREDALEEDIPVANDTTGLNRASSIPISLKIYCDISSHVALSSMPIVALQFVSTYDHCTVHNG